MDKIVQTAQATPTIGIYETFGLLFVSLVVGIVFVVGFLRLIKEEKK